VANLSTVEISYLPGQNFECTGCGRCCRGWNVAVDAECRHRVRGSLLELRLVAERGPVFVEEGGRVRTAHHQGGCTFLLPDSRCSIHAEMGGESKPLDCQQFPFMLCETPEGLVVGISFYCASAQANSGLPLARHEPDIRRLLKRVRPPRLGFSPLPAGGGALLSWPQYRLLEDFLRERLAGEPATRAVGQALTGLAAWLEEGAAPEALADCLRRPLYDGLPALSMEAWFAGVLVAALEGGAEQARLSQDLVEGREVCLPRFGWRGTAGQVADFLGRAGAWMGAETTRYLEALVFRKAPALRRPVLDNLALMASLPCLLAFYAAVSALGRGSAAIERPDWHRALEISEGSLVTHAPGYDPLYAFFARSYRRQVAHLLAHPPDPSVRRPDEPAALWASPA
jgi:Fe-S-cluster containining protein